MQTMLPLCVDLDGTLIKSDTLFEAFAHLLKKRPWLLPKVLYWILKGKAHLKARLMEQVELDPAFLPYSQDFLDFLEREHKKGRQIVLITAAHESIAMKVADYLGIFNEVIASKHNLNMKGKEKAKVLNAKFGKANYVYAGNDKADLAIWPHAHAAIVVNASPRLTQAIPQSVAISHQFGEKKSKIKILLKAIRTHQLSKNVLIFIPLFVGHLYNDAALFKNALGAFLAFCFTAIGVYLLNDILDLAADRGHSVKRNRPFAAGDLPLTFGFIAIPVTFCVALAMSLQLPPQFLATLLIYGGLTFLYSFYLKRLLLIDVFVLAVLYTLRILAGMTAIGSGYSEWLLSFSIFFFLSLAFVKRYTELENATRENKKIVMGRAYLPSDAPQVALFGIASGYISVLVFALYISSDKVMTLYRHPLWLWPVCLILLYWLTRLWMFAGRGKVAEDPVIFALKDKASFIIMLMIGCIVIAAATL